MRRYLFTLGWLTLVWVALWEEFTWANVIGGMLAGSRVLWAIPLHPVRWSHSVRPLALIHLMLYFTWKLVEASVLMAWEVVTPRNRVNPAVVSVPLRTRSAGVATAVANMVSLTPGTLTLEVDEETMTLVMHVLHLETIEKSRHEVLYLEELATAALPLRSGPAEHGAAA